MLSVPSPCRIPRLAVALALGAGTACASSPGRPASRADGDGSSRIVTAEKIEHMNVSTAWDVVRKSGFMVSVSSDKNGRPTRLQSRRGRSSVVLANSDTPLVLLDGVRTNDFRVLEQVPARTLLYVRYLTGIEATVSQGTGVGGGMIEVRTRSDP
jgi:hypothetical protein